MPGCSNMGINSFFSGTQKQDWQIYWDNGATTNHFIQYDGSDKFNYSVGRAFWVLQKGKWNINKTVTAAPLNAAGEVEIPLITGWNLVTKSIPWATIKSLNGISQPIWAYNGSFSQASDFKPYEGYYLDNTNAGLSVLRVPAATVLARSARSIRMADATWRVQIKLTAGEFEDSAAWLGVAETASPMIDQFNLRKPRAQGSLPSIYFGRNEWDPNYSTFAPDIRPSIERGESWEFEIYSNQREPIVLTFDAIDRIPAEFKVYLVDETSARYLDLRENSQYQFKPVTEISKFSPLAGDDEALKEKLSTVLPEEFALGYNFPNPFNPATTIRLAIPAKSGIDLKIDNIRGELVRVLHSGILEAGRHWINWDGTNESGRHVASGLYLCQFVTQTGIRTVSKMILMK
ncbi:hypothetical protein JXJ21_22600 [candidate division KSB1 bacterium]|nr:hypothetical protein [candidate division KSB1 bacterium]